MIFVIVIYCSSELIVSDDSIGYFLLMICFVVVTGLFVVEIIPV